MAYMVMTSLAWNLKAWWALALPEPAGNGLRNEQQRQEDNVLNSAHKLKRQSWNW
jgi:hypothetical protein